MKSHINEWNLCQINSIGLIKTLMKWKVMELLNIVFLFVTNGHKIHVVILIIFLLLEPLSWFSENNDFSFGLFLLAWVLLITFMMYFSVILLFDSPSLHSLSLYLKNSPLEKKQFFRKGTFGLSKNQSVFPILILLQ